MPTYILEDYGITDIVRDTLKRSHGIAAHIEDVSHIVKTVILSGFGQRSIPLTTAIDMLCDMGATTHEAEEAMETCYDITQSMIMPVLKQHVDLSKFEVDVLSDFIGNVKVTTGPVRQPDVITKALTDYNEGVDNGDYYPERIRRIMGAL